MGGLLEHQQFTFFVPNFPIDAMESNLCSVLLILSIISIPTALLYLYGKQQPAHQNKTKNTVSTVKIEHNIYTMCGTAVLEIISAKC